MLGTFPDLLITDVRLAAFNGLHLLLRGRLRHPGMAAVITAAFPDEGLKAETAQVGASYLEKPVNPGTLLGLVTQLVGAA